eukprot:8540270-Pyramimonas_sp.AAC.1
MTTPDLPPCADDLFDSYFSDGKTIALDRAPAPRWGRFASLVLAPARSAPGVHGEPYAVYHAGARFIACLIAQT